MRSSHPQDLHHPTLEEDNVRQGVTGHHVRHVLGLSLSLALVFMLMSFVSSGW
ncbi:hypothetical protein ACSHT0_04635 [Tepidicaulis sp. LMO-SS28]|uniref:hypothetical protein n=1 Tax=Tepidicaulis sp. LMO-SS28 TaxID=3447455 RepID=UPI003EE0490F